MLNKWTLVFATVLIAGFASEEYITHCPTYSEPGSEIFTVLDTYNCVATPLLNDELFISCGLTDTNDKGNYNITMGGTVSFEATASDLQGFYLTYESVWDIPGDENTTIKCWNFTARSFNASPIEPIPTTEPERYTGYNHICRDITLSEDSQVIVTFKFEEYNDGYTRFFMYSYDCPGVQGRREYASSGCYSEICNSSGQWCHMGTASERFETTVKLTLEQGAHQICAWPSSIAGYLWDAEINYRIENETVLPGSSLDLISITDILNHYGVVDLIVWSGTTNPPPITNITFELASGEIRDCDPSISYNNPIMLQQVGSIGITCNNIEYDHDTSFIVTFYTENAHKEFILTTGDSTQIEPVNLTETAPLEPADIPLDTCLQKGESDCTSSPGCYWTDHCGCLHEDYECAEPLEQDEIIVNCPTGCICYDDGSIHCPLIPAETETTAALMCPNGCTLNNRCVITGTRVELEDWNKYCDIDGGWKIQKPKFERCQNDYECQTNTCASGQCYDIVEEVEKTSGLLQKILDFFARIFGIEIRN